MLQCVWTICLYSAKMLPLIAIKCEISVLEFLLQRTRYWEQRNVEIKGLSLFSIYSISALAGIDIITKIQAYEILRLDR